MIEINSKISSILKSDKLWFRQCFEDNGGLGKFWKLFGEETEKIIMELNEELAT